MSMEIDYDVFWDWAVGHFGDYNVIKKDNEICINSPFVASYKPDTTHHLYCNTSKGIYHCWKSDKSGTLYNLVKEMMGCSFPEAVDILGEQAVLRHLNRKLGEFFKKKETSEKVKIITQAKDLISLPEHSHLISSLSPANNLRKTAEGYLKGRKIPIDGLYVCEKGMYGNRIVIPYYGPNGNLIYFNARDLSGRSKLRYQGPPKEVGIGKGDVIWIKKWPEAGSTLYLTEGEFDAMSLWEAELCGAALGGKNLTLKQFKLLESYEVTICFDLDKSGLEALNKVSAFMRSCSGRVRKIGYVKPAFGYKDWNDMLMKLSAPALHHYVKRSEKYLDDWGKLARMLLE